jgi:hypothetical protein
MEYLCERAMPFVVAFLALLVVIFIPFAISAYQSVSSKGYFNFDFISLLCRVPNASQFSAIKLFRFYFSIGLFHRSS